jgi:hypothetical protein
MDRVGVIYPYAWPLPNLVDVGALLRDRGYVVDLLAAREAVGSSSEWSGQLSCDLVGHPGVMTGRFVHAPGWMRGRAQRPYRRAAFLVGRASLVHRMRHRHESDRYVALVGCDAEGVLEAARLAKTLPVPYLYWSLEIATFHADMTPAERALKDLETVVSRNAAAVIVQDQWRARLLATENGLEGVRTVYLPNSRRQVTRLPRETSTLRARLGIPQDVHLVIYTGFLADWAECRGIAQSAAHWPNGTALLLNSRAAADRSLADTFRSLAPPGRVYVNLDPVPDSEYGALLRCASAGVALYSPKESPAGFRENLEVVGFSSGKIAAYLQFGLPVIVGMNTGPRELVEEFDCGVCVEDPHGIGAALRRILADRPAFSERARTCFAQRLALEPGVSALADCLDSLRDQRC